MATRQRRVVWAESATAALDEVISYIDRDSRSAAVRVLSRALEVGSTLGSLAERGPSASDERAMAVEDRPRRRFPDEPWRCPATGPCGYARGNGAAIVGPNAVSPTAASSRPRRAAGPRRVSPTHLTRRTPDAPSASRTTRRHTPRCPYACRQAVPGLLGTHVGGGAHHHAHLGGSRRHGYRR